MKIHSYELLAIQLALFRTVVLFSKEKTARWAHQTNLPSQGLLPNPLIPGSPRSEQLHHKHCLIFIKNPQGKIQLEPQNPHCVISHPRSPPFEILLQPKITVTLTTANRGFQRSFHGVHLEDVSRQSRLLPRLLSPVHEQKLPLCHFNTS